jgi:hypothetical protein
VVYKKVAISVEAGAQSAACSLALASTLIFPDTSRISDHSSLKIQAEITARSSDSARPAVTPKVDLWPGPNSASPVLISGRLE